jgi:aspartyl/asparaginyl-tRNA synthetase
VSAHEGNEITLRGWVYNRRSSGKLQFILLRDGTGVIQCVAFKGNFTPEEFEMLDKLTQESSIEIRGKVRKDIRSPGGYEMDVAGFKIVQLAELGGDRATELAGRRLQIIHLLEQGQLSLADRVIDKYRFWAERLHHPVHLFDSARFHGPNSGS